MNHPDRHVPRTLTALLVAPVLSACAGVASNTASIESLSALDVPAAIQPDGGTAKADPGSARYFERVGPPESGDGPDRIICRREAPTGSHLKRTVCRSAGEILAGQRKARSTLQRASSGRLATNLRITH